MRPLLLAVLAVLLSAGEAELPADAIAGLDAQAKSAPDVAGPTVVGTWIWGGRADREYRPFFEWDLRLASGPTAIAGLRARVATLGPKQEVLREGSWIDLGAVAARSTRDVALRLNCPTFGAWRLDLTWDGGSETFIGTDKQGIPTALGDASQMPLLLAVNGSAEPEKGKKGSTVVTWNLWNLGGVAASGVTQTVKLRDAGGKVVATGELKEKSSVAPRSARECRLVLTKVPAYAAMAVEVRHDGEGSAAKRQVLRPPLNEGRDLAVEELVIENGSITATAINRLGRPLRNAVINIVFTHGDKTVKDVNLAIETLADGETAKPTSVIGTLPAWDGYSVGWRNTP